jgi:hypothetical protein
VAASVDGTIVDLKRALPAGQTVKLKLLTDRDPDALKVMRHSAAHVMARAVMRVFPNVGLAFGPTLPNGFYYDFDMPDHIREEDFPRIEKAMAEIIADAEPFDRFELPRDEAIGFVSDLKQELKVQHLKTGLADHPTLSFYRQGEFVDLCRGPHIPDAGRIKAFKLLSVAASHFKGDASGRSLQRLYGTAFFSQKDLDAYLATNPVFTGDQSPSLASYLNERLSDGGGDVVMAKVLESRYRPSQKLLEHTAAMVAGQQEFILLDEQYVVFESVLAAAREGFGATHKSVMLVKGGPGTGKSVIALHLVGRLAKEGFNAQHATGSKAFTENMRRIVGKRARAQFAYFNQFGAAEPNDIDVLILDEAHRLRETSAHRFQPKDQRTNLAQVDELVKAAKTSVFFIDDLQAVRPNEVGSTDLIKEAAAKVGADLQEFELETQFRCAGSKAFVSWIDNTLGLDDTANPIWEGTEGFDFRMVDSVEQLDAMSGSKADEGQSARLVAGFCWPWSDPLDDGTLVPDVKVGNWQMPWNAKSDAGRLANGIPQERFWASDPRGINQVGCIYTAQGFEFDYVGVIFGRDLRWDPVPESWIGDRSESHDSIVKRSGEQFTDLVKRTYRVLLTRGMKGCYVVFEDLATQEHVVQRLASTASRSMESRDPMSRTELLD